MVRRLADELCKLDSSVLREKERQRLEGERREEMARLEKERAKARAKTKRHAERRTKTSRSDPTKLEIVRVL